MNWIFEYYTKGTYKSKTIQAETIAEALKKIERYKNFVNLFPVDDENIRITIFTAEILRKHMEFYFKTGCKRTAIEIKNYIENNPANYYRYDFNYHTQKSIFKALNPENPDDLKLLKTNYSYYKKGD